MKAKRRGGLLRRSPAYGKGGTSKDWRVENSMPLEPKADKQISLLLAQYEILAQDIRALEGATERILGAGIALITAFLVYAYKERINEFHFAAAPACLGLLLYVSNQWGAIFWKAGYKRGLEDRINALAGAPVLDWEAFAERSRRRLTRTFAMFGGFVLAGIAVIFAFSLWQISANFGAPAAKAFVGGCAVLGACLCYSVWQGARQFERSYLDAKAFALKALAEAATPPASHLV